MPRRAPTRILALRPIPVERVWGGRALARELGRCLPPGLRIGESWEVADAGFAHSVVADGEDAGNFLRDVTGVEFPLLVKWIDARETLSVQVHPDDRLAAELEGERCGKSEAWLVVGAAPGARLLLGLRRGVTRRAFERACREGGVETLVREVRVRAGDVVYSPAGTVHAIGGGLLLLEVQQPSDTTYRLHDWGRRGSDGALRPLHIEKGLRAARVRAGRAGVVGRFLGGPRNRIHPLLRCAAMRIDSVRVRGRFRAPGYAAGTGRPILEVWAVLSGRGRIGIDSAPKLSVAKGDCRVVVGGVGRVTFESVGPADFILARARPGASRGG